MSAGGKFTINVWQGGYPVWCELLYEGEKIKQFDSYELRDLEFACERARKEAAQIAQVMDKKRANDY